MTAQDSIARQNAVAPASLLPNPFLYVLPRSWWGLLKQQFSYTAVFVGPTVVPANGSTTVQTNINADSAYVIIGANAICTDTGETSLVAYVPQLVQINDQAGSTNLFDQPTHFMNVFGTGVAPSYWAIPKIIMPSSTLSTTLTNLDAANARNVRIAYLGFKVYNVEGTK